MAPAQARDGGPVISRVTPAAATPGTALEIEGYRMGVNLENHEREKVRVVFAQGGKLLAATHGGGSWMTADVQGALQSMTVIVPEGLEADACHVRVEVGELRSAPASIEIKSELIPAVLTNLRPRQIRPGAVLWVYGTNFTTADEAELTDARGKTRRIAAGSPDGTVTAFTLPKDTPEGEVTVNIIQPQGDASVRSNSLRVLVTEGPAPLDIHGDSLMPVAPGQWLDLVVTTFEPLEKADRLEVSFRQGGQTLVVAAENLKHPRVRVPDGLAPGDAEIQTRTWSGESFSTWAEPVTLRLLERPAPPHLYSVEIVPSRVDLEFRQEGRLIEVTRFDVETHPRLR
ncbi:MAG: hypothetical protein ACRD68_02575, partial [Pyrinomonadaceae bacterium]